MNLNFLGEDITMPGFLEDESKPKLPLGPRIPIPSGSIPRMPGPVPVPTAAPAPANPAAAVRALAQQAGANRSGIGSQVRTMRPGGRQAMHTRKYRAANRDLSHYDND